MPLLKIRSVKIALGIGLGILIIPLGLTLRDLFRVPGAAAWLRLGSLVVAIAFVAVALMRQRSVASSLMERERLDSARRASDAMFASILAIAADAIVTVD